MQQQKDPEVSGLLQQSPSKRYTQRASLRAFLAKFWPLGLVSFGGPQAHVALMHDTFVDVTVPEEGPPPPRLPESTFLELYALCQSLPGPGSTQLATSLGATFGGFFGALLTFLIFAIPGMTIMTLAGKWYHSNLNSSTEASTNLITTLSEYLVGLISAAFAMVALAAYKIIRKCCAQDKLKYAVCVFTSTIAVVVPPKYASIVFIALLVNGGVVALTKSLYFRRYTYLTNADTAGTTDDSLDDDDDDRDEYYEWHCGIPPRLGAFFITLFMLITAGTVVYMPGNYVLGRVFKIFWTIGAMGFGGGIVVIPMILNEIVESGLLPSQVFLAGFALFGCVPGPMFAISAFLGAAIASWRGAVRAILGLYFPGIIILLGVLPFWEQIRRMKNVRTILKGVNSAAAGLILAGVWMLLKRTMVGPASFSLAISATVAMTVFQIPAPIAIVLHGILGSAFVLFGIGGPFRVP